MLKNSILSILVFSVQVLTLLVLLHPPGSAGFRIDRSSFKRSPVILVPGDGGSQLEAKLNKTAKLHMYCDKTTDDYFNLWLNPNLLIPAIINCWVDNMRLVYNNVTRTTSNSPGVHVRVPGFGNTTHIEWLDPSSFLPPFIQRLIMSSYYVDIVNGLVDIGYKRNVDIRGAPYDYRKAPNEMGQYYDGVKKMVEETYERSNQTKVTFVCHSMGCPITNYLFNQQSQAWKDKYIKGLISLSGAYGGAVKAMKTIASGENLGILIVKQSTIKIEQMSSSSLTYMLPSRHLWGPDEVLAFTKTKNYTVANYEEFFRDIDHPTGYEMYKDTFPYADESIKPPRVEVICIYGFGLPTTEMMDYRKDKSLPNSPTLVKRNFGDGTVNERSLKVCSNWEGKQKQKVTTKTFKKMEHLDMLSKKPIINIIKHYVVTW
ncbi:phospholipase A2 group XV-like [Argiope bruennichi]|uniref:phospholipase A2 group XV-like n=1 Tax=Argiope bruennichi TaxID=94029 RepID=UPI0024944326|nr:phospholipase A2 group XV-like [Argiope bruennichi]